MNFNKISYSICELFKDNGVECKLFSENNREYLLVGKEDNADHIIEIAGFLKPMDIEDLRQSFISFESMSRFGCNDYKIISLKGYLENIDSELDKIRGLGVSLYDSSEVEYLEERLKTGNTSKLCLLYSHNERAYSNIVSKFKESNYAAIVHATGTGKSRVFLKVIEREFKNKNVIMLAPSVDILNQTESLATKMGLFNIKYMTYAKLYKLTEEETELLQPSLIIADELHRLGARTYGDGFKRLVSMNPDSKVLGVTATPIRTLDYNRDMIEELFHDNNVSSFSLEEALLKGVLPKPKYVYALYDIEDEITSLRRSIDNSDLSSEKKIDIVRKLEHLEIDWEKSSKVSFIIKKYLDETTKKIVVFCENITQLRRDMDMVKEWFIEAGYNVNVMAVTSEDSNKVRKEKLEKFKNTKTSNSIELLFCVNILNEGVHISDINGCIFLRRTVSEILYLQQLGRVLEANKKEQPIVFDLVCNIDNVKNSAFEYRMKYYDTEERNKRKMLNLDTPMENAYYKKEAVIETYNESENIEKLLSGFRNSIKNSWNMNYKKLTSFKLKHGHADIFKDCSDSVLFVWCINQMYQYEQGKLEKEKIKLLNEVEFKWYKLNEIKWFVNFLKLREYIYTLDSEKSKSKIKEDEKISRWCASQRKAYKNGTMKQYKIILLNSIHFDWSIKDVNWSSRYVSFVKEYRLCDYNFKKLKKNKPIYSWVIRQREKYNHGVLDDKYVSLLDQVTLQWRNVESEELNKIINSGEHDLTKEWINAYLKLSCYFDKHGDSDVSTHYTEDVSLGYWVKKQRENYEKGKLSDEKIKLLNNLNFRWHRIHPKSRTWKESYQELLKFYNQYNHCNVPRNYDERLYKWILRQRQRNRDNLLKASEYELLSNLNFTW